MKKIHKIILLLSICLGLLISCSDSKNFTETSPHTEESSSVSVSSPEHSDTTAQNSPLGGSNPCAVHNHIKYHSFPSCIVEHVGQDAFNEWLSSLEEPEITDPSTQCVSPDFSIYNFVKYFNIPREDLEQIYFSNTDAYYYAVWNIDLIYSGTEKEYDEYFTLPNDLDIVSTRRGFVRTIKFNIKREYAEQWEAAYGKPIVVPNISIHELAYRFGITEAELRELSQVGSDYIKAGLVYDYDYSAIYNEDGSIKPLDESLSGIEQDALFCGIDDIYLE